MDPDATLERARAALATMQAEKVATPAWHAAAADFADAFADLDAWLRAGGFQPAAWLPD